MTRHDYIEIRLNSRGKAYWRFVLCNGIKGSNSPAYYPNGTTAQSVASCMRTVRSILVRNRSLYFRNGTGRVI